MAGSYERAGKPTLPNWWVEEIGTLVEKDERSQNEIAQAASQCAGRKKPWDGSAISKLFSGSAVTRELANALSDVYGKPRPYFEARSPEEASAMEAVSRLYDAVIIPTTEQQSRREAVTAALDAAVSVRQRHGRDVASHDEGRPGSRGARRTARSR